MAEGRGIKKCAAAAGYGYRVLYNWRAEDPEFAKRWNEAYLRDAGDYLEDIARERAVEGYKEPVFYKGKQVGHVVRYDHNLLMRLLERRVPEYRQKVDVTGQVEHHHSVEHVLRSANERAVAALAEARGLPAPDAKVIEHE